MRSLLGHLQDSAIRPAMLLGVTECSRSSGFRPRNTHGSFGQRREMLLDPVGERLRTECHPQVSGKSACQ